MKFYLLINVIMPTIVGISTFMSRKIAFKGYLKMLYFLIFYTYECLKFHVQLSLAKKNLL